MISPMAFFSDEHKARVTDALVSGDLARTTAKIFHECDANKTTYLELSHGEVRVFVVQVFAILGLDPPNEALIYDIYKRFDVKDRGALDFEECLQLVVLLSNVVLGIQKPLRGMVQADVLSRSNTSSRWSSGHYPASRGPGRSLSPRSSAYRTSSPRTLGNPTGAPLDDRHTRAHQMGSFMRTPSPRTLGNPSGFPRPASPSRSGLLLSNGSNSRISNPPSARGEGQSLEVTPACASSRPQLGPARQSSRPSSANGEVISLETTPATPASLSSLPTIGSTPGSSLTGPIRRADPGVSLSGLSGPHVSLSGLSAPQAARPPLLPGGHGEWAVENVIKLATYPRGPFACKVKILPRRVANTVPAAVDALNNGSIECAEDFCVAYSEAVNSHFLLYKRGKELEAWDGLDMPRPSVA